MHQYFFLFLIFFAANGLLQAILMLLSSVILLFFLIFFKPFTSKFDLVFGILNTSELIIVFGACCVFYFVENPESLVFRQQMGIIFLSLVFILFFINTAAIAIYSLVSCLKKKKKTKNKRFISKTSSIQPLSRFCKSAKSLPTSVNHSVSRNMRRGHLAPNCLSSINEMKEEYDAG